MTSDDITEKKTRIKAELPENKDVFRRGDYYIGRRPCPSNECGYKHKQFKTADEAVVWQAALLSDAAITSGIAPAEGFRAHMPCVMNGDGYPSDDAAGGEDEDEAVPAHAGEDGPGCYVRQPGSSTDGAANAAVGEAVSAADGEAVGAAEGGGPVVAAEGDEAVDAGVAYAPIGLCGTARVTMNPNSIYNDDYKL